MWRYKGEEGGLGRVFDLNGKCGMCYDGSLEMDICLWKLPLRVETCEFSTAREIEYDSVRQFKKQFSPIHPTQIDIDEETLPARFSLKIFRNFPATIPNSKDAVQMLCSQHPKTQLNAHRWINHSTESQQYHENFH